MIDYLRAELDCFAPDLRGFGAANAFAGPYTVDQYADDVAHLVKSDVEEAAQARGDRREAAAG